MRVRAAKGLREKAANKKAATAAERAKEAGAGANTAVTGQLLDENVEAVQVADDRLGEGHEQGSAVPMPLNTAPQARGLDEPMNKSVEARDVPTADSMDAEASGSSQMNIAPFDAHTRKSLPKTKATKKASQPRRPRKK